MTLAPVSAVPTMARKPEKSSRPVPAHSTSYGARPVRRAQLELVVGDVEVEQPGRGVDGDQVAVAHPRERAAEGGLGGHVDRGEHLARRARTSVRR